MIRGLPKNEISFFKVVTSELVVCSLGSNSWCIFLELRFLTFLRDWFKTSGIEQIKMIKLFNTIKTFFS